jgi:hypothetical protein
LPANGKQPATRPPYVPSRDTTVQKKQASMSKERH